MEKPIIAKHVFNVAAKEHVTPHYIRITLRGDGAADFKHCTAGANNKIFIPPTGEKNVQFATFDTEKAAWVMPDENMQPIVRTYTHRGMGAGDKEIIIDFVDHGDHGPASTWARAAVENDQLGVAMKLRETALCPPADWYFLIGDATAIPVLSCILESLPATAQGHCLVEVATPDDIHPDIKHSGFTIQYIFNAHPDNGSELAQQAKKVVLPDVGSRFAYIACEYTSVKELRKHFREDLQWTSQEIYAFSYWKAGVAEDKSASDRREEKEQKG